MGSSLESSSALSADFAVELDAVCSFEFFSVLFPTIELASTTRIRYLRPFGVRLVAISKGVSSEYDCRWLFADGNVTFISCDSDRLELVTDDIDSVATDEAFFGTN